MCRFRLMLVFLCGITFKKGNLWSIAVDGDSLLIVCLRHKLIKVKPTSNAMESFFFIYKDWWTQVRGSTRPRA